MRGTDFLNVAEELAAVAGSSDAKLRTAVSRAYYGAFLEVRETVRPFCGAVIIDQYSSHANVRTLLSNSGVDGCRETSKVLQDLHKAREQADYALHWAINYNSVRFYIRQAKDIAVYVQALSGESRARLRDGLYKYLLGTHQLGRNFPAK